MNIESIPRLLTAKWNYFDPIWYEQAYGEASANEHFYLQGSKEGRSPNALFNELWYRNRYKEVLVSIKRGEYQSGFEHYKAVGFIDYSPNPFFDEKLYRVLNPELFSPRIPSQEHTYINGFDHYLAAGEMEGRAAGPFFDYKILMVMSIQLAELKPGQSYLELFLTEIMLDKTAHWKRTSLYFDTEWYVRTYPQVLSAIDRREIFSATEHYTLHAGERIFNPSNLFSEEDYKSMHPDVYQSVAAGHYQNCFEHFIMHGIKERRQPKLGIDLKGVESELPILGVLGSLYNRDVYAYLASEGIQRHAAGSQGELYGFGHRNIPELWTKKLFLNSCNSIAQSYRRTPIRFTSDGSRPLISVIIVAHNKFELTMNALSCLSTVPVQIQTIVVDSGSTDETTQLARYVDGINLVRFTSNIGYTIACNVAIREVMGEFVLLLNNDVTFPPNAVPNALARIRSSSDIGAVGGKIIRSNGLLQEAGCIIWRDGRTSGYLRGSNPNLPEANFVREVDFCSAVFLLVRADLLATLQGYDVDFAPAYYEDADLCVRLAKLGYKTVYDPSVIVHHLEYGSSGEGLAAMLMERSREKFCTKHIEYLREKYAFQDRETTKARSVNRSRRSILLIEDIVPERRFGSGYVRSNDIVNTMSRLGYAVTVFPLSHVSKGAVSAIDDFGEDVELLTGYSVVDFPKFIRDRSKFYDILWICRSHNMRAILPTLSSQSDQIPQFSIVLDTEAVVSIRDIRRRTEPATIKSGAAGVASRVKELGKTLDDELNCGRFCRTIVAVNSIDAWLIRSRGHQSVSILGHFVEPKDPVPRFLDTANLLFVGAVHSSDSPNLEGVKWFISEVLPILRSSLLIDISVTIAGYISSGVDVAQLFRSAGVVFVGEFQDAAKMYRSHRIFIAPTRTSAGIPYKIHEATSYGIPVVANSMLCRQLNWVDEEEIIDGGCENAEYFARRIYDVYTNQQLWEHVQVESTKRIKAENSYSRFASNLEEILERSVDAGG